MPKIIILLIAFITIASCKSHKSLESETKKQINNQFQTVTKYDSIRVYDSIIVNKQDSTKEIYHYRTSYVTMTKTDSIFISDTIFITKPTTKKTSTEKNIFKPQTKKIALAIICIMILAIGVFIHTKSGKL